MTAANNNFPQEDHGMFPNMIQGVMLRDRDPNSTVVGLALAFEPYVTLRRDNIVEKTKGLKPHGEPYEQISKEGTSNDARKSLRRKERRFYK